MMKKLLSLILCFVVLSAIAIVPASAGYGSESHYSIYDYGRMGDVDGNDDIDSVDVVLLLRRSVFMPIPSTQDRDYCFARLGDVNNDGYINVLDATIIQRYLVGLSTYGTSVGDSVKLYDMDALRDFNAMKTYAALKSRGLNKTHIAGALAWIDSQSSFDSAMIEGEYLNTIGIRSERYCFGNEKNGLFNSYSYLDSYTKSVIKSYGSSAPAESYYIYTADDGYIHYLPGIGLYGLAGRSANALMHFAQRFTDAHWHWFDIDVQLAYLSKVGVGSFTISGYKNTYVSSPEYAARVAVSAAYGYSMGNLANDGLTASAANRAQYWFNRIQYWEDEDMVNGLLVDYTSRISKMMR